MRLEQHSWPLWQQAPSGDAATALWGMSTSELLTLAFAALSVVVAGIGAWLANQRARAGETTAREALDDARLARIQALELALWTSLLEAVNKFANFDPAREPIGTRLDDLRIRMMLLIDHSDDWDGFDKWLAEEHALGTALGRQAMELHVKGEAVDAFLARIGPYSNWAVALITNLRWLRRNGYKKREISYLYGHAKDTRAALYEARQWGPMPVEVPGLVALDAELIPEDSSPADHA